MYKDATEVVELIREYTMKLNFKGLHELVLRTNPVFTQYHNPTRKYREGEVFNIYKTGQGLNHERIKYVVLKDITDTSISLDNIEYYQPYQTKLQANFVLNEFILKDMERFDGDVLYKATRYIGVANKRPSETTDGKWELVDLGEER